jgi:hypothetical protein
VRPGTKPVAELKLPCCQPNSPAMSHVVTYPAFPPQGSGFARQRHYRGCHGSATTAVLGTIDMASSELVEALDALEALLIDASKVEPSAREAHFSNAVVDAERRVIKAMKDR